MILHFLTVELSKQIRNAITFLKQVNEVIYEIVDLLN
jgi:hypothetical protein